MKFENGQPLEAPKRIRSYVAEIEQVLHPQIPLQFLPLPHLHC